MPFKPEICKVQRRTVIFPPSYTNHSTLLRLTFFKANVCNNCETLCGIVVIIEHAGRQAVDAASVLFAAIGIQLFFALAGRPLRQ